MKVKRVFDRWEREGGGNREGEEGKREGERDREEGLCVICVDELVESGVCKEEVCDDLEGDGDGDDEDDFLGMMGFVILFLFFFCFFIKIIFLIISFVLFQKKNLIHFNQMIFQKLMK